MWVKFDDGTAENPKVWGLSDGAFRLWFASICYCQKWLTDGLIDRTKMATLMPRFSQKYVTELLKAGCLEEAGDSFLVHDFTEINKTREYWESKRKTDNERLVNWRATHGRNAE